MSVIGRKLGILSDLRTLDNPRIQYLLKDTFGAAEQIKKIPKELLRNEEYTLISLDVVSLFTNVPLRKTVNIMLDYVS